jgi:[citrate (pro-3S)-lyase] ligase
MSFENSDFRVEILDLDNPFDVKYVSDFLAENGFEFDINEVETTMILYNLNDDIIGTGSHENQTLKFVVVAEKFRETSAFSTIVSYLTDKILVNYKRCFVFTKPENSKYFESLGFSEIANAKPLFSVLEFGFKTIVDYQEYLKKNKVDIDSNNIAAIVVNCNPFTVGHQFLIEKASAENDIVYLFVVKENLSLFPYEVRKKIIKEGVAHLKNVIVISSGPYIVSGAIFPNYFLKSESWDMITQKQAEIDVSIFAKYIVPILGIKKRYIGTENYCNTTRSYNSAMKTMLPKVGCEVFEITRKSMGMTVDNQENFISASKVRNAIKNNNLEAVLNFLPEVTKNFLLSDESLDIRNKIIASKKRH